MSPQLTVFAKIDNIDWDNSSDPESNCHPLWVSSNVIKTRADKQANTNHWWWSLVQVYAQTFSLSSQSRICLICLVDGWKALYAKWQGRAIGKSPGRGQLAKQTFARPVH